MLHSVLGVIWTFSRHSSSLLMLKHWGLLFSSWELFKPENGLSYEIGTVLSVNPFFELREPAHSFLCGWVILYFKGFIENVSPKLSQWWVISYSQLKIGAFSQPFLQRSLLIHSILHVLYWNWTVSGLSYSWALFQTGKMGYLTKSILFLVLRKMV